MKRCPYCHEVIDEGAIICRFCGKKITGKEKDIWRDPRAGNGIAKWFVISFCAIVLIFCGMLINAKISNERYLAAHPTETPTTKPDTGSALFAYQACKESTVEILVSPSTADFQTFADVKYFESPRGTFVINYFVDSQNTFGATIRNKFSCNAKYSGEGSYIVKITPN